ncbi:sugar phosphate isomerase/epimerase [Membranicola marinus]|uniref:Sugar phosphate isomerase/epimerase n=1 Tax=Membranihabitans marinus TaxID=1227546 RepID=A0A953HLB1_9BACT|nr:sugar phosphate isomerase/epimerase family protein [Membranihabitans marinus]MBY5956588.1 sugar phosphate isomerase/epimerase [Membranihabitans marinus]
MKNIKGPAIFLAQFASDESPYNSWRSICNWAASLGYKGVQLPTFVPSLIDLEKAATSKDYCDELKGIANEEGIVITELSTHLQGQLVAVNPAYDELFDGFAPPEHRGNPKARTEWAIQQLKWGAAASRNLGIDVHGTFSGALIWQTVYPWPQRPQGLVDTAFNELARRWKPILDVFDEHGVDVCYELHPGEDLHDGLTFERFLEAVDDHPRANILYDPSHFILQQLKYLDFIDIYHERIRMFHVKDAEFNPTGKAGVYGGYAGWVDRPGRFRSLGDGQVDFKGVFTRLSQYGYDGWAVLEWEDCIKSGEQGAAEGAPFIADHIIEVTDKAFDDFAGGEPDEELNRRIIGL